MAPTATPGSSNIQADEATNTLIIQAPPRQLKMLREVIARLDVRRNQVLVEGIIAEISTSSSKELGVQWRTSQPTNEGIVAGSSFSGGKIAPAITGAIAKGAFGFADGFSLGYLRGGDIRALLNAFSGDSYTDRKSVV